MRRDEFKLKVVDPIIEECRRILLDRGEQYASVDDFLENFKHTAIILSEQGYSFHGKPLTPESVCLLFSIIKNQRWSNRLKEDKDPHDDNVDGINYILLGAGSRMDSSDLPVIVKKLSLSETYPEAGYNHAVLVENVNHTKCGVCGMYVPTEQGRHIDAPTVSPIWTCNQCIAEQGEEAIKLGYEKM